MSSILLYWCEKRTLNWHGTENLLNSYNWHGTENLLDSYNWHGSERECFRRFLHIPYTEHKANNFVRQQVNRYADRLELLLAQVKRWKLSCKGRISNHELSPKTILHVKDRRKRGRQRNPGLTIQLAFYAWQRTETSGDGWLLKYLKYPTTCFNS